MRKQILCAIATALVMSSAAIAQQIAFTSRISMDSPVLMASLESSNEYGFATVTLRNDGHDAVIAVHLEIIVRDGLSGAQDEVADQRRIAVHIDPQEMKRVPIEMGQIAGLRNQTRSRRGESALAIIAVAAVEFRDGTQWKRAGSAIQLDPARPPAVIRQRDK